MRIVNIIGTRPQYIKLAGMYLAFNKTKHKVLNIDTGQHYDYNMSDDFIKKFNLVIHHKTMNILKIRKILKKFNPDVVLLYGDTYSTLVGWIASKGYRTAHIESGVRVHNRIYIEEIIRMAIDRGTDIHFVPGRVALENLINEGIFEEVYPVGDVTYDLLLNIGDLTINYMDCEYIYMTLHRPQNVENKARLQEIMNQLEISGITVVFPVHPRTAQMIKKYKISIPNNIHVIAPISYIQSLRYIKNAKCVVTDSGGVEKECYLLETQGIILNKDISWPETLYSGWNKVTNVEDIHKAINTVQEGKIWYECYGHGEAGKDILKILGAIVG